MKKENNGKLRIIPLGGLEKIGMNITAFEYEDSIVVVDCGLAFPEDDMLGIDLVIPDITYLKENIRKVKGFVITHGHEDHIGALSYVLREMNLPIYATKLTMGIIERKLGEHNLLRSTRRKVVRHGQSINLGQFRIEFIKTNHSIQDAAALAIYSPAGIVVHTGDFKVDYTPVFGDAIAFSRNIRIPGSSSPPSRPMWTGCSRSSTPLTNTGVRSSSKAGAWSISFPSLPSWVISVYRSIRWWISSISAIIRTTSSC